MHGLHDERKTPAPHARRLIFVNRYYRPDQSATSQMLTDLAEALAARGFEVHVVCSRQLYGDAGTELGAVETLSGVRVHRVATTRFGRDRLAGRAVDYLSFYVSGAVAIFGLLRGGDVIIAKTDPPLLSIIAAPLARLRSAALVNWQQDVFPEIASHLGANPLPRVLDRVLRHLRDASLRAACMNVVIGGRMMEYLAARKIPSDKLVVIDNWADAAIVPKPTAASALRAQLGLVDRFVVAYSGNLGRAHEYDTLLAAAEALADDPAFVFLMIGGGAKMQPMREAVAGRGLKNFSFLPYQPRAELTDSLAAADVHLASLIPALEGLIVPSKLYGILAAGRPTIFIGDPDGDIARVLRGADCGLTVRVGAFLDLADALRRLRTDTKARTAMGARARAVYADRYSPDAAVAKWLDVLALKPARRPDVVPPPVPSSR